MHYPKPRPEENRGQHKRRASLRRAGLAAAFFGLVFLMLGGYNIIFILACIPASGIDFCRALGASFGEIEEAVRKRMEEKRP